MLIGLGIFFIYSPLCMVRRMEKFNVLHIFADFIILFTFTATIVYTGIYAENEPAGTDRGLGKRLYLNN
jgi:hypothetical protein